MTPTCLQEGRSTLHRGFHSLLLPARHLLSFGSQKTSNRRARDELGLGRVAVKRKPIQPDLRRPRPGSVLSRTFRGQTIEVKVLEDGFEYQGQRYGSLSAVARAATGTRWNGLVFFGLGKREMAKPAKAHRSAAR